jgi:ATP synthase protein I
MASDSGRGEDLGAAGGADQRRAPSQQDPAAAIIVGYPVSGMVAYGGIGWLIGHWTHMTALFPVGLCVGLVLGIVAMFYRLGRR